jgi:DNA-binding MarR family transcriptional regulator
MYAAIYDNMRPILGANIHARNVNQSIGERQAVHMENNKDTRSAIANRLFFRLYQCANMLHKTGTRAIEEEGLTTQQWAVLGALSRPQAGGAMKLGELARYLMVSRQNLAGVIGRLERDGRVESTSDPQDGRSRLIRLTPGGRQVWQRKAVPKIQDYYEQALEGFSVNDMVHTVHYLLKILENMQKIDTPDDNGEEG